MVRSGIQVQFQRHTRTSETQRIVQFFLKQQVEGSNGEKRRPQSSEVLSPCRSSIGRPICRAQR